MNNTSVPVLPETLKRLKDDKRKRATKEQRDINHDENINILLDKGGCK